MAEFINIDDLANKPDSVHVIVCASREERGIAPLPGSSDTNCDSCGKDILIAQSSLRLRELSEESYAICNTCAFQLMEKIKEISGEDVEILNEPPPISNIQVPESFN